LFKRERNKKGSPAKESYQRLGWGSMGVDTIRKKKSSTNSSTQRSLDEREDAQKKKKERYAGRGKSTFFKKRGGGGGMKGKRRKSVENGSRIDEFTRDERREKEHGEKRGT